MIAAAKRLSAKNDQKPVDMFLKGIGRTEKTWICSWTRFCEQAPDSGQVSAYWRRYELVVSFPRATPFTKKYPYPGTVQGYVEWIDQCLSFVQSRNKRIDEYIEMSSKSYDDKLAHTGKTVK